MTKDKMSIVNDLLRVQGMDGNWNYDPYMQGLYNGMEVVISILEDREPVFKDAWAPRAAIKTMPDKWLHDRKDKIAWKEMKETIQ